MTSPTIGPLCHRCEGAGYESSRLIRRATMTSPAEWRDTQCSECEGHGLETGPDGLDAQYESQRHYEAYVGLVGLVGEVVRRALESVSPTIPAPPRLPRDMRATMPPRPP